MTQVVDHDDAPTELLNDDGNPVPVNPPEPGKGKVLYGTVLRRREATRRPIFAAWLRNWREFKSTIRWFVGYVAHIWAFHLVRTPLYVLALSARSPIGLGRAARAAAAWIFDFEAKPLRIAAVDKNDPGTYMTLVRARNARVVLRGPIVALTVALLAGVAAASYRLTPLAVQATVVVALLCAFGWVGRPIDKPVLGRAVLLPKETRLTDVIVTRALGSLGIAQINQLLAKNPRGLEFPAPIARDGMGWLAVLDLPHGVTVTDVREKREELASGLRRSLGCVWPEGDPEEHAGRLMLWVGDRDMARQKPPEWPLAGARRFDLFEPVPFVTDPRGRWVYVTIPENNTLIGAIPGAGKTATVRVYMCAGFLDPTCELWVYNFKGNNDLVAAKKVATRYASGMSDAAIEQGLFALRELRAEIERRAAVIEGLPIELCPDGKVTRELADKRSLGLHLLMVIFDECQNLFAHSEYGKEASQLADECVRLGRALGVHLVLATQRPDKDALPKGISGNVAIRYCLRVTGQVENDMILGTSMYKQGHRATLIRPSEKGVGILVGATDEVVTGKGPYIDLPTADRLADRGRALREQAGLLRGFAAGEQIELRPDFDLLEDVLLVIRGDARVWSETLLQRLTELRPGAYEGWDQRALAAGLKTYGVEPKQIWGETPDGEQVNRRGFHREHIQAAIDRRFLGPGAAPEQRSGRSTKATAKS